MGAEDSEPGDARAPRRDRCRTPEPSGSSGSAGTPACGHDGREADDRVSAQPSDGAAHSAAARILGRERTAPSAGPEKGTMNMNAITPKRPARATADNGGDEQWWIG